jgi:hypothetical protein
MNWLCEIFKHRVGDLFIVSRYAKNSKHVLTVVLAFINILPHCGGWQFWREVNKLLVVGVWINRKMVKVKDFLARLPYPVHLLRILERNSSCRSTIKLKQFGWWAPGSSSSRSNRELKSLSWNHNQQGEGTVPILNSVKEFSLDKLRNWKSNRQLCDLYSISISHCHCVIYFN